MMNELIRSKMKQGVRGGARRGCEYLAQIDETFIDGIKGIRC